MGLSACSGGFTPRRGALNGAETRRGTKLTASSSSKVASAPIAPTSAPRVKMTVFRDGEMLQQIDCRRVVTLIGSRAGCKIHVKHACVSAVHLAIVNTGEKIIAIDLMSKRGTMLNGLRLEHEELVDGDVLDIKPWQFRINIQQPPSYIMDDKHPVDADTPEMVALEHVESGRVLRPERDVCLVGRRLGCDIHIDDDRVSRAHVLLIKLFGRPVLFDLLTRNHTEVNGKRVGYHALADDDIVTVGTASFRVKMVGRSSPPPALPGGPDDSPLLAPIAVDPGETGSDLLDIEEVESTQSWNIAEQGKPPTRKPKASAR